MEHDENPPPPVATPTQQAPHTVSTIKLPILKKDTNGQIKVLPPKTAEEILARERERKARTTLLMAIPEDHLAKFPKMTDAKEMWEAIKSRFGISTEDANQKFIRFLPYSWSQVSLIIRTKPRVDSLRFDDLYNNLRVFESDIKGSTRSSSSAQNVAFVSFESTNSTNDVSTAYGTSTSSRYNSQRENPSSYTDELMHSFFANQSGGPQMDHEDLKQINEFDLEEMDLKWNQLVLTRPKSNASIVIRQAILLESAYKKRNQDKRRRDAGNTGYKAKYNGNRPRKQEEHKALVTLDGDGVDWTDHAEDDQMSVKDKVGLGFSEQVKENELYDEALLSVFDTHSSDIEDAPLYDRFAKVDGMHAVPPPMTGNYMPPGPDIEIDDSIESMPKLVIIEPRVVSQPKVWSDAPIIKEYESDSDDEYVISSSKEHETPSFTFVNTVKHVKTPRETVKEQNTCSQSPKVDKRDWDGLMSKKLDLGYGFTRKACFVCGNFSHLIRDCDFHEKRMAKKVELNKQRGKGTGQRENRPVNTAGDKAVSVVGGIGKLLVRPQQIVFGDPKSIIGINSPTTMVDQTLENDDPHKAFKNKGIVDSGCSRHITGNKAYLVDYQDYNGGTVAFGGSKGYITSKGTSLNSVGQKGSRGDTDGPE
ncbi:hypothetical protein Tco_1095404 [Tanacetum coccineum]